jgi:hypothetical protein
MLPEQAILERSYDYYSINIFTVVLFVAIWYIHYTYFLNDSRLLFPDTVEMYVYRPVVKVELDNTIAIVAGRKESGELVLSRTSCFLLHHNPKDLF